jgi:3-hydroxybutyryl-CoA dehydratase
MQKPTGIAGRQLVESTCHVRTEFEIGERASITKEVTEDDIASFARITGDYNRVHIDPEFASRTRFKGRIAHGMLSAGLISAVLGTKLPGSGCIYLSQNLRFVRPVRIGDTLTAEVEVTNWNPRKRIVHLNTRCFNQAGEDVVIGEVVLLMESLQV